jgi:hypothetical protein
VSLPRWPLHPQPGPLESLSSWLERTARAYPVRVSDLKASLGRDPAGLPVDVDLDPPAWMLAALAERTGADLSQLRAMTLAGWQPWLFDVFPMDKSGAQHTFDTYVRANSVLLASGEAGAHDVSRWRPWGGPWIPRYWLLRACPACAADPGRGRALLWRIPLTAGCADHGCRLEDAPGTGALTGAGDLPPPVPLSEPLAALDRYTHEAVATGMVALHGRTVRAGVWFRLLRSLLDEVSIADSHLTPRSRADLDHVWRETGRPRRGGLTVWRPYEQMDWPMQEAMLHAAAVALRLTADSLITPRGVLGSAVRPAPRAHVYDGDQPHRGQPRRDAWEELVEQVTAAVDRARTDPGTARHLLAMLTTGCRTLGSFEEQRSYLFGIGIPAAFLPSARELGRADLA